MSNPDFPNNVFIIIPAFNEQSIIKKVVGELVGFNYTVVIIDDGSAKEMWPELKEFPSVHYIRHKVNLGQGAALQTGISYALQHGASYLVTFDADGQHTAADIPAMLEPLQKGEADITLASRFLEKGSHNASFFRQFILKTGRLINYFFTGLYLSDSHNGLRAMPRHTAANIQLKENRMAHATEFLFIIRRQRLRYKEIPARITYTSYSKSKGQSLFNSIRIFFDLVLHKLFE